MIRREKECGSFAFISSYTNAWTHIHIYMNSFFPEFILAESIAGKLDDSATRFVFVPSASYMFAYFACHDSCSKDKSARYNRYFRWLRSQLGEQN